MLYSVVALALTLGSATGLVVTGIPAMRTVGPAIQMNAAEAAAKAAWLAKLDGEPSWLAKGSSSGARGSRAGAMARFSGYVASTSAPAMMDDHTNPAERIGVSGPNMGRVPMATAYGGGPAMMDDHTNPDQRIASSGPRMGRVPMATALPPGAAMMTDDHTNPAERIALSGPPMGRVPMAYLPPSA